MKCKLPLLLVFLSCLLTHSLFAQDKSNAKFGKVSPEDFATKVYSIDSNASAVVIADIGSTQMIGNSKGWFSLEHKHYKRVHILNKNGYDVADVSVELYTNGDYEEQLDKLKAVTYNLENGKVVETKLDVKSGVFKDKISKNLVVKKFTFPNIKEGSIIEFEYTKLSDFLRHLEPWEFQGEYPRLWSEYNVTIPAFFSYVFLTQGYRHYDISDKKESRQSFTVRDNGGAGASETSSFTANVSDYRWAIKNVPTLKEESYTSTLNNHIAKIEFQLTEQTEPLAYHRYLESWQKLTGDLLKAEYFGLQIDKDNGWINDYTDPVIKGVSDELEKAKRIFTFVRDNFTCTNYNRYSMDQNLRTVARNHNGNVAEINILLTAMLRHEKIYADPVLLSTRSHGYTYALYPLPDKFNYVICKININGKNYYLDASKPQMGFGKLGYECYNGHARVVDAMASPIDFTSDSLTETSITSVFMINDEKGSFTGSVQKTPGYYASNSLRKNIKDKGEEQFFTDIKKGFSTEVEITDKQIDSLNKYDDPVAIKYSITLSPDKEDVIYFNPMLSEAWKDNPFKSAERFYPVEMPYAMDQTYLLRLSVPEGYRVDEMPKQMIVKLNEEGEGMFEYRISESNGIISMRSRLQLKRTYFQPDEYEMLREFFNLVVKKHAEQIVFKKK
ncbi:MAG: transglutaminase domain-containing protein [Chitinophagaceae bacterium]